MSDACVGYVITSLIMCVSPWFRYVLPQLSGFLFAVCCVRMLVLQLFCSWFAVDKEHGNVHRNETNTKKKSQNYMYNNDFNN
jgi:hypothetical protein